MRIRGDILIRSFELDPISPRHDGNEKEVTDFSLMGDFLFV